MIEWRSDGYNEECLYCQQGKCIQKIESHDDWEYNLVIHETLEKLD